MKSLVSVAVLVALVALALTNCCLATGSGGGTSNDKPTTSEQGRQGRSISSMGATNGNQLGNGGIYTSAANAIDLNSKKSFLEQEKREVQNFVSTKNIIKTIIKLFFGNNEEVSATSRSVLGVISKMLDLLKNTFGQKSRNGSGRTIRDNAEDAASASVSMLQGYVKSVLTPDPNCAKRYLCQASNEAIRDGRDLGYVISTVGGYATSYLLDPARQQSFKQFQEASLKGRAGREVECEKLYHECKEVNY